MDPTRGRAAGTPLNAELDPTAGRAAGTPLNAELDPTTSRSDREHLRAARDRGKLKRSRKQPDYLSSEPRGASPPSMDPEPTRSRGSGPSAA